MYQALYRKWRPSVFEDVAGQPHITATLRNEIKAGRVGHAYLFMGSRGTGKTTCAKILAKAVNCLHPKDGDPCNACEICRGIDDGSILDVSEIDAASNNGVDDIRGLREEAGFTPAKARYRVFIIDEAHMLSAGAFNALLKTLEEPPAYVIFILATTEAHKIPATIVSRCQRFDFRRIPAGDIARRLSYVAGQEHFALTDDAAMLIARLSDGGLRDALSLLDQCAASGGPVTAETVSAAAGLIGDACLDAITAAILNRDPAAAMKTVDELYRASKDVERLCEELTGRFRDLLLLKTAGREAGLVARPERELAALEQTAARLTGGQLLHILDTLQDTFERMRRSPQKRTELETCLLKLCMPELDTSPAALLRRIETLERAVRNGGASGVSFGTGRPASAAVSGEIGTARGSGSSGAAAAGFAKAPASCPPAPQPAPKDKPDKPVSPASAAGPVPAAGQDGPAADGAAKPDAGAQAGSASAAAKQAAGPPVSTGSDSDEAGSSRTSSNGTSSDGTGSDGPGSKKTGPSGPSFKEADSGRPGSDETSPNGAGPGKPGSGGEAPAASTGAAVPSEAGPAGPAAPEPLSCWPDVLEEIARLDPPLCAIMKGSFATVQGDRIQVDSPNAMFADVLHQKSHKTALIEAVRRVTGKRFRVGVSRRKMRELAAQDPLDELEQSARQSGIDITETQN